MTMTFCWAPDDGTGILRAFVGKRILSRSSPHSSSLDSALQGSGETPLLHSIEPLSTFFSYCPALDRTDSVPRAVSIVAAQLGELSSITQWTDDATTNRRCAYTSINLPTVGLVSEGEALGWFKTKYQACVPKRLFPLSCSRYLDENLRNYFAPHF